MASYIVQGENYRGLCMRLSPRPLPVDSHLSFSFTIYKNSPSLSFFNTVRNTRPLFVFLLRDSSVIIMHPWSVFPLRYSSLAPCLSFPCVALHVVLFCCCLSFPYSVHHVSLVCLSPILLITCTLSVISLLCSVFLLLPYL